MCDLWCPEIAVASATTAQAKRHGPTPCKSIIHHALLRELTALKDHSAHAQLGVAVNADDSTVERAYQALRRRFDPAALHDCDAATVAVAQQICELLAHARRTLRAHDVAVSPPPAPPPPSSVARLARWLTRRYA